MFDAMKLRSNVAAVGAHRLGKLIFQCQRFALSLQSINDRANTGPMTQHERQSLAKVGLGIKRDRDVIQLVSGYAGNIQAITNRLGGKTGPMFDPVEPLLLHGRHQLTVNHQGCRGVTVISVDSQNRSHRVISFPAGDPAVFS